MNVATVGDLRDKHCPNCDSKVHKIYMDTGNPKTRLTFNILLKTASHFVLVCAPCHVSHHLFARCGYSSVPCYKSDMYSMYVYDAAIRNTFSRCVCGTSPLHIQIGRILPQTGRFLQGIGMFLPKTQKASSKERWLCMYLFLKNSAASLVDVMEFI